MKSATILLELETPSNNDLIRMNKFKYRDLKNRYIKTVYTAFNELVDLIPLSEEKEMREIKIISVRSRLLDPDNFIGGLKPLIDAIKELKYISDDSPKRLKLYPVQILTRDHRITDSKGKRIEIKGGCTVVTLYYGFNSLKLKKQG